MITIILWQLQWRACPNFEFKSNIPRFSRQFVEKSWNAQWKCNANALLSAFKWNEFRWQTVIFWQFQWCGFSIFWFLVEYSNFVLPWTLLLAGVLRCCHKTPRRHGRLPGQDITAAQYDESTTYRVFILKWKTFLDNVQWSRLSYKWTFTSGAVEILIGQHLLGHIRQTTSDNMIQSAIANLGLFVPHVF